jgi:hypothetical protein
MRLDCRVPANQLRYAELCSCGEVASHEVVVDRVLWHNILVFARNVREDERRGSGRRCRLLGEAQSNLSEYSHLEVSQSRVFQAYTAPGVKFQHSSRSLMQGHSLSWAMRCKSALHSHPSICDASRPFKAFPCTVPLIDLFVKHHKANESSHDVYVVLINVADRNVGSCFGTSHPILDIIVAKKRRLSWFLR